MMAWKTGASGAAGERGNLTAQSGYTYGYSQENRLTSVGGPASAALGYDPLGRLEAQTIDTAATTLLVDTAGEVVAEVDSDGTIGQRWVPGAAADEKVAWYDGPGVTDRRFLSIDAQGSTTAVTDSSGTLMAINTYDPYGAGGSANLGAIGYTGQYKLIGLALYYYKARAYSPELGRFLQTDPAGYSAGMNLYAYVGGDPINGSDPLGLASNGNADGTIECPGDPKCNDAFGDEFIPGGGPNCPPIAVACVIHHIGWLPDASGSVDSSPASNGGDTGGGSRGSGGNGPSQPTTPQNIIKNIVCHAPPIAGGGGIDAYAGVGTSLAGAASVNPRNGQISFGLDLGVGFGLGGGARYSLGKFVGLGNPSTEALPIAGAGVNVNGTIVAGPVGGTGSYQLVGSNRGEYTAAYTSGAEFSGNVNVSAHVQINLPPLFNLGCP